MRKLLVVLMAAGFVAALAHPAFSQAKAGLTPAGEIRVFDVTGLDLGAFLGWPFNLTLLAVLLDESEVILLLDVETGSLNNSVSIKFEQPGCQGQGWITAAAPQFLQGPILGDLFAFGDGAAVPTLNVESFARVPNGCEDVSVRSTRPQVPVRLVTPSDLGVSIPVPAPLRVGRGLPRR